MRHSKFPAPLSRLLAQPNAKIICDVSHGLPLWYWETNENFELTYLSGNIETLTGVPVEELIGVCILNPIYGRGEVEVGLRAYHDLLRSHEMIESFCYERILISGERVMLMDSAVPQFSEAGQFTGYTGLSLHFSRALQHADGTGSALVALQNRADALESALSQRNADLIASNRNLSQILDALGEGLLVTETDQLDDPDNRILFANPAYRRMLGFAEQDIYSGQPFVELRDMLLKRGVVPPKDIPDFREKLFAGEAARYEISDLDICLQVRAWPQPDGGLVIVHSDVTELERRNEMLEQSRSVAEQATKAKSNFLANMSHEIRTPMNGIVGVADLLAETKLSPTQKEFVETIRHSALVLTQLIGDILDFSKIEAGHLSLTKDPFSLEMLLNELAGLMGPLAAAKRISFSILRDENLPDIVEGDAQRLRQVLINLLGNAIKFTEAGAVTLRLRPVGWGRIEIVVTDTGIGIAQDQVSRIFNQFEQAESGMARSFEGTGLGLAITSELVVAMGGEITVNSAPGQGARFAATIDLPATEACLIDPVADLDEKAVFNGQKVLLAEDNKTNQFVVRRMLDRFDLELEVAEDGAAAFDLAKAGEFDLILMDVSMPVMTGLEACRAIRKVEQAEGQLRCPIVALTGNAYDSDREACTAAGMDGFLTKPVRANELTAVMARHLIGR